MNRPPQKADWWFEKHQKECGGTYHLIKSPDKPTESKKIVTVESLFKKCGKAHKLTDSCSVCPNKQLLPDEAKTSSLDAI